MGEAQPAQAADLEIRPPKQRRSREAWNRVLDAGVSIHGIQSLRAEQQVFADNSRWADLSAAELVRAAVAETVGMFLRHERFLRAVVLTSASHPEIRNRGSRYSQELGNGFAEVVLRAADAITLPDVETAVHSCFSTVFAASVIRVAYGPGFARPVPVEDDAFTADLAETAVRYLLSA
jgi:hypothetical protein